MHMRKAIIWAAALLAGSTILASNVSAGSGSEATSTSAATSPSAAAQSGKLINIPAGTRILIRMVDSIDSSKQKTGFRFTASLETDLRAGNVLVAPRGSKIYGVLAQASSSGKFKGSSQLTLELTDIVVNGSTYPLLTSTYEIKGKGEGGNTAKKVVGGAGLGALIGGIAGGGKGAGIGALAGAATGTAVAATKKGEQLQIPSESLLEFRLQQAASLPASQ
jgi:hypothetical protein